MAFPVWGKVQGELEQIKRKGYLDCVTSILGLGHLVCLSL